MIILYIHDLKVINILSLSIILDHRVDCYCNVRTVSLRKSIIVNPLSQITKLWMLVYYLTAIIPFWSNPWLFPWFIDVCGGQVWVFSLRFCLEDEDFDRKPVDCKRENRWGHSDWCCRLVMPSDDYVSIQILSKTLEILGLFLTNEPLNVLLVFIG